MKKILTQYGVVALAIIIVPKGTKDAPMVLTRTPNNANRPTLSSPVAFVPIPPAVHSPTSERHLWLCLWLVSA